MKVQLVGGLHDGRWIDQPDLPAVFYTPRFDSSHGGLTVVDSDAHLLAAVQKSMERDQYRLRLGYYGAPYIADDGTYRYDLQKESTQ